MKQEKTFTPTTVGGSSLLVIFGLVCFAIFALLSLNTVLAQQRLSERSIAASAEYYRADLEAQRCFAQLRAGQTVEDVTLERGIYRYSCPISQHQDLYVEVQQVGDDWLVLRWQAVPAPDAVTETMPLWTGEKEDNP